MTLSRSSSYPILVLSVALGTASWASAGEKPVVNLTAFAVDMSSPGSETRTGRLDITIVRWSTDAERESLREALIAKGSDALLTALQGTKPRVGYIQTATGVGWDLRYARQYRTGDGTRRIVIATDRPISYWEAANGARSADYEFTLAEVRLPKNGKGTGKLVNAAKVSWNKETRAIEVENYENEPVRLSEIVATRSAK